STSIALRCNRRSVQRKAPGLGYTFYARGSQVEPTGLSYFVPTRLADLLVERGWLMPADKADLERLLERKLRKNGGSVHTALAAVVDGPTRRPLSLVGDADIAKSVAELPENIGRTLVSTISYVPPSREHYSLTRLHATGGIGQVWLARDATIG